MRILLLLFILNSTINSQWVQTNLGDAQYGNNLYSTSTTVFAATLNGVYSTDATGDPWFSLGPNNTLVFDVITSNEFILAATETETGVYRSSDNGANWNETNGISNQSVRAFAKNSSYIFACTWGGGIFRSGDDGNTWDLLGLIDNGFRSIFTVGETIFAGGHNINFSTNNGDTWEARELPYPGGETWCFCYNDGILYAGGMGLYISNDLGNTWQLKYGVTFDGDGNAIDSKLFKDIVAYKNILMASVAFNSILISYDGGNTWNSFDEGLISDWTFSALAIKEPYIWALRDEFGNAYIRLLNEITDIYSSDVPFPIDYLVSQNYPNPFNPSTIIKYSIPKPSNVTLKVFDILGSEAETLVNREQSEGNYEVEFDGSELTSGIYFYRLRAGDFVETKKMILIK